MSKFLQRTVLTATFVAMCSSAQAQVVPKVAMYGEYHETNGQIVNIPQNPPIVPCLDQHIPANPRDARCHHKVESLNGVVRKDTYEQPRVGNHGAQVMNVHPADVDQDGLDVGDPFILPPKFARQRLGRQGGVVLNDTTDFLDTTFTAQMPATNRTTMIVGNTGMGTRKTAPLMRHFSQMNWTKAGNGQNNGVQIGGTPNAPVWEKQRPAPGGVNGLTNVLTFQTAQDTAVLTYKMGPRQFGGTMGTLLDGGGTLFLRDAAFDALAPAAAPVIPMLPLGDGINGNIRTLNGGGWDWTLRGGQAAGPVYGFPGPLAALLPPVCPPTQVIGNCNQFNGDLLRANGIFLFNFPAATSVKHEFPLTTGTVSIVRTGVRGGNVATQTNTGMGYDTVMTGPLGLERNVGLVAGSYTIRKSPGASDQINIQVLGVALKFTPEPAATAALTSGLGLLGLLGYRRRS